MADQIPAWAQDEPIPAWAQPRPVSARAAAVNALRASSLSPDAQNAVISASRAFGSQDAGAQAAPADPLAGA